MATIAGVNVIPGTVYVILSGAKDLTQSTGAVSVRSFAPLRMTFKSHDIPRLPRGGTVGGTRDV